LVLINYSLVVFVVESVLVLGIFLVLLNYPEQNSQQLLDLKTGKLRTTTFVDVKWIETICAFLKCSHTPDNFQILLFNTLVLKLDQQRCCNLVNFLLKVKFDEMPVSEVCYYAHKSWHPILHAHCP
jgi:hypothetical protein